MILALDGEEDRQTRICSSAPFLTARFVFSSGSPSFCFIIHQNREIIYRKLILIFFPVGKNNIDISVRFTKTADRT